MVYDINKRILVLCPSVGTLVDILNTLPRDAKVMFSGCDCGYLHVNKDETVICIDSEDLDEDYGEE